MPYPNLSPSLHLTWFCILPKKIFYCNLVSTNKKLYVHIIIFLYLSEWKRCSFFSKISVPSDTNLDQVNNHCYYYYISLRLFYSFCIFSCNHQLKFPSQAPTPCFSSLQLPNFSFMRSLSYSASTSPTTIYLSPWYLSSFPSYHFLSFYIIFHSNS